jgi:hypothetical protein
VQGIEEPSKSFQNLETGTGGMNCSVGCLFLLYQDYSCWMDLDLRNYF